MTTKTKPITDAELFQVRDDLDSTERALNMAKTRYRAAMKRVTPGQWKRLIEGIEAGEHTDWVKIQVACIVWWAYFANEDPVASDLDKLKSHWGKNINLTPAELRSGLKQVGISAAMAKLWTRKELNIEHQDQARSDRLAGRRRK